MATEKSGRAIPRGRYALWLLGLIAYGAVAQVVAESGVVGGQSAAIFVLVYLLGLRASTGSLRLAAVEWTVYQSVQHQVTGYAR